MAAQKNNQILAPLQYEGMMHSQFFEAWFEKHLMRNKNNIPAAV